MVIPRVCSAVQESVMQFSTMQCSAVQCSAWQYTALPCSAGEMDRAMNGDSKDRRRDGR